MTRQRFGSGMVLHSGPGLSETYLLLSLRVPDKTSEDREKCGHHNVELTPLILLTSQSLDNCIIP